ncbi:MAG: HlyD family efflux transporter periplasmic adaptor subunit [Clostridia bacterium]|nr:HlyD family efflux transporter periplasmic adaptor subunit [Clostridia bacterium]
MKKKILLIVMVAALIVFSFVLGRQVGLNTEDDKTKTVITEETVSTHDIQTTLTGSGEVAAKTTEKLELSTSKYFKALCVENDDTVKAGANILEYMDGTFLTAPYDLVVISNSVPEAESKCTSSNYIEVSALKDLTTTISVNENEINSVAVGQEVEITLSADESKKYTGKVTKVDSVGTYDTSGTTFSATVEFENDGNIKLGMSLSCTIILKSEKGVKAVPIAAVYENSEGQKYVNKINANGEAEETIVETGIADENYVQIVSGLELDDKVQIITETTESSKSSNENSGFEMPGMGGEGMQGGNMPERPEGGNRGNGGNRPDGAPAGNSQNSK